MASRIHSRLCLCACLCGPTPAPTSFHSNAATWETSVPTLPPRRPPCLHLHRSFFRPTNGEVAGGRDVCCVRRVGFRLPPSAFLHQVTSCCTNSLSHIYKIIWGRTNQDGICTVLTPAVAVWLWRGGRSSSV